MILVRVQCMPVEIICKCNRSLMMMMMMMMMKWRSKSRRHISRRSSAESCTFEAERKAWPILYQGPWPHQIFMHLIAPGRVSQISDHAPEFQGGFSSWDFGEEADEEAAAAGMVGQVGELWHVTFALGGEQSGGGRGAKSEEGPAQNADLMALGGSRWLSVDSWLSRCSSLYLSLSCCVLIFADVFVKLLLSTTPWFELHNVKQFCIGAFMVFCILADCSNLILVSRSLFPAFGMSCCQSTICSASFVYVSLHWCLLICPPLYVAICLYAHLSFYLHLCLYLNPFQGGDGPLRIHQFQCRSVACFLNVSSVHITNGSCGCINSMCFTSQGSWLLLPHTFTDRAC